MNRLLVFILMIASSLSVSAQLNGDGFYRIQNQYTSRYVLVLSNKGDINYASNEVDLGSIETIKGFDKVVSNPASIIYLEAHGDNGYVLKSQGTDTYSMIGYYLKIRDNKNGTYKAYATAAGITKYLSDEATTLSHGILLTNGSNSRDWYIRPVNQEDEHYFGILPEFTYNGNYYTTIYASFPFCFASEGMNAYYIDKVDKDKGVAVYKEISDFVPVATPVIIKCTSELPSSNKLNLLKENASSPKGNLLGGVYFNNSNKKLYNQKAYDPATMRVLGYMNDGSVGFVTADIDFLPANKAYLTVPEGSPAELSILSQDEYTTGIQDVVNESRINDNGIYTITGMKIECSQEVLLPGIYIINGKKVVVK